MGHALLDEEYLLFCEEREREDTNPPVWNIEDRAVLYAMRSMLGFCKVAKCQYCQGVGHTSKGCPFRKLVDDLLNMQIIVDAWDPGLSAELETDDGKCQHCRMAPTRGSEVCSGAYGEVCEVWERLEPEVQKKCVEEYNSPEGLIWRRQIVCDDPRFEDCKIYDCEAHETCKREYHWK